MFLLVWTNIVLTRALAQTSNTVIQGNFKKLVAITSYPLGAPMTIPVTPTTTQRPPRIPREAIHSPLVGKPSTRIDFTGWVKIVLTRARGAKKHSYWIGLTVLIKKLCNSVLFCIIQNHYIKLCQKVQ